MSRWGLLATVAVIIALLSYLLWWPSSGPQAFQRVWEGEIAREYSLHSPHLLQVVSGDRVQVADWSRPLDRAAAGRLWQIFTNLRADRFRAVDEADLPAFGIDGWRLSGEGIDLRWGYRDQQAYLYNGAQGRLAVLERATFDTITRAAGRLDVRDLIPELATVESWVIDDLQLVQKGGEWVAAEHPQRPPLNGRLRALSSALAGVNAQSLDEVPEEEVETVHRLLATTAQGQTITIEVQQSSVGWLLRRSDFPAQVLNQRQETAIRDSLAALAEDRLFDIPLRGVTPTLRRVEVWQGDAWWFTIEQVNPDPVSDDGEFALVWTGGRERVSSRALWAMQQALNTITVDPVQTVAGQPGLSAWKRGLDAAAPAIHIRAWDSQERLLADLHLLAGHARSSRHLGPVAYLPELLSDLAPDRLLDLRLLPEGLAGQRLIKLQRVHYQDPDAAPSAEVFAREQGPWTRLLPADGSIDQRAVERIVNSLLAAEGQGVSLGEEARGRGQRSLALRIAGIDSDDGRMDTDLLETIDRDWGLRLHQREDGDWDGEVIDAGLTYHLAADLVDAWFAPVQAHPVLPVLANLILAMRFEGIAAGEGADDGRFSLRRGADGGWRLVQGDSDIAADGNEVRRLLAGLSALHAHRVEPTAGVLSTAESVASIILAVPGAYDERDGITIAIGSVQGGERVLSVHRTGSENHVFGRMWVDAAAIEPLLSPAQRYRPLAGQRDE